MGRSVIFWEIVGRTVGFGVGKVVGAFVNETLVLAAHPARSVSFPIKTKNTIQHIFFQDTKNDKLCSQYIGTQVKEFGQSCCFLMVWFQTPTQSMKLLFRHMSAIALRSSNA